MLRGICTILNYLWISSLTLATCTKPTVSKKQVLENQLQAHKKEIALGKLLFMENRLSINNTRSCGTCHNPTMHFTDGYRKSLGAYADELPHNSPTLVNLFWNTHYSYTDSTIKDLRVQMKRPLHGNKPIEMGLDSNNIALFQLLSQQREYKKILNQIGENVLDYKLIINSLYWYELSLINFESKWDSAKNGNYKYTDLENKGFAIFTHKCANCHGGINHNQKNTGGMYVKNNRGIIKIPNLRFVTNTAPYFNNGRAADLEEVLTEYSTYKSDYTKIALSKYEKRALIEFLRCL